MSKKKISISWSGGKDSAYALYQLQRSGEYDICDLHTAFDANLKRVGLHGVPQHLIQAQAEAIGLPLKTLYLPGGQSHDAYERMIRDFCREQKANGVDYIMFGDIFLEDLKAYRDRQLASEGLKGVYPIWGKKTGALVHTFVDEGFKTIVCAANAAWFDPAQVGKTIDATWLDAIPENVDPCGENGEFHTFVYDGPLFKNPVDFQLGEVVEKHYEYNKTEDDGSVTQLQSTFWFQDIR